MEFTKAQHFQHTGYVTSDNRFIPVRFTIISKVNDDNTVSYKVSYCSHRENQYIKRTGIDLAQQSPMHVAPLFENSNTNDIVEAMFDDLANNHLNEMPRHHRRYFSNNYKKPSKYVKYAIK